VNYEKQEFLKQARRRIVYLQHRLDQIVAKAKEEGRDLNDEEWDEIQKLVND